MPDLPQETLNRLLDDLDHAHEAAARTLYQHYHDFLYGFVRHHLNVEADVEEVVQDTLIAVCRKPKGFKGESKFSSWLCAIARRKAVSLIRKNVKAEFVQGSAEDDMMVGFV